MCLDRLSKEKFKIPREGNHNVGWKVFVKDDYYHLHPQFGGKKLKINEWLREEDYRRNSKLDNIQSRSIDSYPTGFHLFLDKKDAESYGWLYGDDCIRKIYYKKPTTYGYQDYKKVVVAKEIFIPPIRKV